MPRKPKIENVAKRFGYWHGREAKAKAEMAKHRKMFFDLIEIPEEELAQQTIFAVTEDPDQYVATLYPKWKIISAKVIDEGCAGQDAEWKLIIQEDPKKKTWQFINPVDQKVYQRTVVESAPEIDFERLAAEEPDAYESITFQPDPPPRQLKPLDQLEDDEKEILKSYLLPVELKDRMEKPRPAKPEELEGLK